VAIQPQKLALALEITRPLHDISSEAGGTMPIRLETNWRL